eukprot:5342632-Prymnesium_polylepis.2
MSYDIASGSPPARVGSTRAGPRSEPEPAAFAHCQQEAIHARPGCSRWRTRTREAATAAGSVRARTAPRSRRVGRPSETGPPRRWLVGGTRAAAARGLSTPYRKRAAAHSLQGRRPVASPLT